MDVTEHPTGEGRCTWRWSSTRSPAGWWTGRSPITSAPSSSSTRWASAHDRGPGGLVHVLGSAGAAQQARHEDDGGPEERQPGHTSRASVWLRRIRWLARRPPSIVPTVAPPPTTTSSRLWPRPRQLRPRPDPRPGSPAGRSAQQLEDGASARHLHLAVDGSRRHRPSWRRPSTDTEGTAT